MKKLNLITITLNIGLLLFACYFTYNTYKKYYYNDGYYDGYEDSTNSCLKTLYEK